MTGLKEDLTGRIFGMLTVQGRSANAKRYEWDCMCVCGSVRSAPRHHLTGSAVSACLKCTQKRRVQKRSDLGIGVKHGHSSHSKSSKLYNVWSQMRWRCNSPKCPQYQYYGGRGIKVCERWNESFANFLQDVNSGYQEGLSLDRVDNDGDYSPENCAWATRTQQMRNTRANRVIEFAGKSMLLTDWANELGLTQQGLIHRLHHWDLEKALTTSARTEMVRSKC